VRSYGEKEDLSLALSLDKEREWREGALRCAAAERRWRDVEQEASRTTAGILRARRAQDDDKKDCRHLSLTLSLDKERERTGGTGSVRGAGRTVQG
jgi:hypothetical protein